MRDLKSIVFSTLFLCVCGLLSACSGEKWEPGVIAKVDGEPIYLRQLEAKYDFDHFEWDAEHLPRLKELKAEYRGILLDLIVQKLVEAELEKAGETVADKDVLAREDEVRNDYPEGGFEKILVEEYVDLNYWREQVRAGLQWENFEKKFLRPKSEVSSEAIKKYYRKHIRDFYVPRQIKFLLITGQDEEMVRSALRAFKAGKSPEEARAEYESLTIHEYLMPPDQLPAAWSSELEPLKPGESSEVKIRKTKYFVLYVLEHKAEKILRPYRAYALIEEKLMQERQREVFFDWLKQRLENTRIQFSGYLKKENEIES